MELHPLILRDHYRRWWWAHLVGLLGFGTLGVLVGSGVDSHRIPLGSGAFLGAVTLAMALNARTNARTLLSLPIRAVQLGTTLWWIAVPLSALAPTAGLAAGWMLSGFFGNGDSVDPAALLRFLLLTQSVSAFQFTVLSFMPHAHTADSLERMLGGITGALWGIGLSASCSFTQFWTHSGGPWDSLSLGILGIGLVCGLLSWRRRTAFLVRRARRNQGSTAIVTTTSTPTGASLLDGFAGLYVRTLFRTGGVALALSVLGGAAIAWSRRMGIAPDGEWMAFVNRSIGAAAVSGGMVVGMVSASGGLSSLRHWRTLPMSASRMASHLIGLNLTGCVGWILPLGAMNWWLGRSLGWSTLGSMVLGIGLVALLLAFVLRFGMKAFMIILWAIMVVPALSAPFLRRLPAWGERESAVAGIVLLLVAWAWMGYTLRHRSRIFTPGFYQFGGLSRGA